MVVREEMGELRRVLIALHHKLLAQSATPSKRTLKLVALSKSMLELATPIKVCEKQSITS